MAAATRRSSASLIGTAGGRAIGTGGAAAVSPLTSLSDIPLQPPGTSKHARHARLPRYALVAQPQQSTASQQRSTTTQRSSGMYGLFDDDDEDDVEDGDTAQSSMQRSKPTTPPAAVATAHIPHHSTAHTSREGRNKIASHAGTTPRHSTPRTRSATPHHKVSPGALVRTQDAVEDRALLDYVILKYRRDLSLIDAQQRARDVEDEIEFERSVEALHSSGALRSPEQDAERERRKQLWEAELKRQKEIGEAVERQHAEERRRLEEERKRREEAERKRREEEQQRAAAEAARKQAEEAAKKQQQEQEAAARRQQEQAAATTAAAPSATPAAAAPRSPAAAAAGASGDVMIASAAAEFEAACAAALATARKGSEALLNDANLKRARRQLERGVTTHVNQISMVKSQIEAKIRDLNTLLAGYQNEYRCHAYVQFARALVLQAGDQVALNPKCCFAIAYVAAGVCAQHTDLYPIVLASFHEACPLTVPKYFKSQSREKLGFQKTGEGAWESDDEFVNRTAGFVRLYAAILQAPGMRPQDASLDDAWRWLAWCLNSMPVTRFAASALETFLSTAAYRFCYRFRTQATRLLQHIHDEYLPRLKAHTQEHADARAVYTRLHTFISEAKFNQKPAGFDLPRFADSDSVRA